MLQAPTSETKNASTQSKMQQTPAPTQERYPRLASVAGPHALTSVSGPALMRSPSPSTTSRQQNVQTTYGNQAVLRTLNGPQQAARITPLRPSQAVMLQRKCACGGSSESEGECAECKAKREGTLQRRAVNANAAPAGAQGVPPSVHNVLSSPGQPLDAGSRTFMEPRFGQDFSGVRVHTDARAAESARAVNALAYTVGHDVVFGVGQYAPGTTEGKRLMAHELTHVVQQGGGISAAHTKSEITMGSPDSVHEQNADQIAHTVLADGDGSHVNRQQIMSADRSIQRQNAPATTGTDPQPSATPPPNPRLTLQIPISLLNFQAPIGGSANVFLRPPVGMRNQNFDQIWQPNIAEGLNLSLHQSDTGIEIGLFAQEGGDFSLRLRDLPKNEQGRRNFFTGFNLQGYLQPAWVFLSKGPHQGSVILQPGIGRTWSDIPGTQGNTVTAQGGLQYTYNVVQNKLQFTGALVIGHNWTWLDKPPSDSPNPQENWFLGVTITLQPVIPLLNWPVEQPGSSPVPSPESVPERPRGPEKQTPEPEQQPEQQQSTPQNQPDTPPDQLPPVSQPTPVLPATVEIFFHQNRPLPGQPSNDLTVLTDEGRKNLSGLIQTLRDNSSLQMQLIGLCSIEGDTAYNYALGQRRAEWLAGQLGIDPSHLVQPPGNELKDECRVIRPGIVSCGAAGADSTINEHDRRVLVRFFDLSKPSP